ncbi:uncharacterized protein TrAFT101_001939 [Trichoderma asperellum]|uniref:uncharacterized protein n=1 Tax=Trichoderma asperellum TaxID=101201 RepID=UPI00331A91AB|nr:hypothetical protein TrAFT101_001939 [Trichoderma asperellum]
MGTPAKKTPSKGRTAAHDRRSPSKALKLEQNALPEKIKTPNSVPRDTTYSHNLPTDEQKKGNGRVTGRSLIMWNRPRMAEKLILHLHYECVRHKVNIPWDAIAHRLRPGSSGAAVLQHVNRLRKELLAEGHMVPPPAQKASPLTPFDPSIRGYVRDSSGDNKHATRAVGFDEKLDDAKINLPDALDALEEVDEDESAHLSFSTLEDDIQVPVTPTPVRHAAPRRPMSAPHYSMNAQGFQLGAGEDAQQFNFAPPNFTLKGTEPLSTKNLSPIDKQTQQNMSGSNLFDPFTGNFSYPPVRPSHGQISPGGHVLRDGCQQPFFMGNPFYGHYAGYYGMGHPGFMPIPPYNFTLPSPPAPAVPGQPAEKQSPLSSPLAVKEREASVSPVSSPVESQVPAFQPETSRPVADTPKEQELDELDAALAYNEELFGHDGLFGCNELFNHEEPFSHDLLLEFLNSN